ncbi:hypothetical protein POSPLADRAFT_1132069 [Postia placenta MAD-698-R-SB12]|uniref:Gluconokinase n=1 Tax=Postia placenta MAD-698-R-SB12 TaxID=670580 RepID=A0A1X6NBH1_9APHY|nr:hypothetical protein POSPLADRAFT_1132069 [Postia placenta MAD-698-R-SB12]OSX65951.1 hypothetical protein POSPLADRAFT_1132069 [Postia placenta MAD-698-R-SB12]
MSDSHQDAPKPVLIVVMGVAGTGKTTLAQALSRTLQLPYIEGDELHPPANIDKMSSGQPLTDADREPWLALLRTTAEHLLSDASSDPPRRRAGALMTCSALRKYYRDILRGNLRPGLPEPLDPLEAPAEPETLPTYFVFIEGSRELLLERVSKRQGHYMKANMVDSQLGTLESPEGEDGVILVGMNERTEDQVKIVIAELNRMTEGL